MSEQIEEIEVIEVKEKKVTLLVEHYSDTTMVKGASLKIIFDVPGLGLTDAVREENISTADIDAILEKFKESVESENRYWAEYVQLKEQLEKEGFEVELEVYDP